MVRRKDRRKSGMKQNNSSIKKTKKKEMVDVQVQHHPKTIKMSEKMYEKIEKSQESTITAIPFLPFQRIIREFLLKYGAEKIQVEAVKALQQAAEMYLVQYLEDAYFCCLHANRKTLHVCDLQCVRRLRGLNDIVNR